MIFSTERENGSCIVFSLITNQLLEQIVTINRIGLAGFFSRWDLTNVISVKREREKRMGFYSMSEKMFVDYQMSSSFLYV